MRFGKYQSTKLKNASTAAEHCEHQMPEVNPAADTSLLKRPVRGDGRQYNGSRCV